jgi:type III pantothenate kinase
MGLNLTIDHGNTLVKLALRDENGSLVRHTVAPAIDARTLEEFIGDDTVDAAIHCSVSVRDDSVMPLIAGFASRVIDLTPDTPTPLTIDYAKATLGVDRLAAAVGAHYMARGDKRDILVIDAGTAITYDVVSRDGHYVGGNIAPGISLRLKSLNDYTARLPLVKADGETAVSVFGSDTASALLSGAIRGIVGEIEYYRQQLGEDALTIITGGSAPKLTPYVNGVIHEPHLVGIGLNRILRYNL